jgi:multimeric flavodoxin WrbA
MKRLLIVYYTRTGGTEQMVRAAADGAATIANVATEVIMAPDAQPNAVLAADGYLFACPENLASMAGHMKEFFDRCYYPALERLNGRPYATMICAGTDGTIAAAQIARIATGWRLREISAPFIVCTHAQTPEEILRPKQIGSEDLARCRELGAAMAAGLEMGIF